MNHSDEQGTIEWFAARYGRATASRFKDVLAKLKNGDSAAARENYLMEIVTERLTGQPVAHFANAAMQWGVDMEPLARSAYVAQTGRDVEECGFFAHDSIMTGASPDGLVEWDGAIEIKCPFNSVNHVNTLRSGMPQEHMAQIQGVLWLIDRDWCDFVSFDPRMPAELKLYVQRILRDQDFISGLEVEVRAFLGEVDTIVAELMSHSTTTKK